MELYTQERFDSVKCRELLPFLCETCNQIFHRIKGLVISRGQPLKYCSLACRNKGYDKRVLVKCKQCEKTFPKSLAQLRATKNNFCSHSCHGKYFSTHRSGLRCHRSKIEIYIAEQVISRYPDLQILTNDMTAIGSELDIYIPSLKIAFELNGIFHYEPIYGVEQLRKVQNNDQRKFQACLERGIEFAWIDISKTKYFKPERMRPYLDVIFKVIDGKLDNQRPGIN